MLEETTWAALSEPSRCFDQAAGVWRHILDVWYRRGDLTQEIERQNLESHFTSMSWHCLLAGYGAFPPLAAEQPAHRDLYTDQEVARFLERCSLNFESHGDNLKALAN